MMTAAGHSNPRSAITTLSNSSGSSIPRRTSLSSFPSSRPPSQTSHTSRVLRSPRRQMNDNDRTSDPDLRSKTSSLEHSSQHSSFSAPRRLNADAQNSRRLRSQYPQGSSDNHVEYILVASFDIDRGPVMEHQYPVAITGDENMLAELMLPDQAHARNQDWTIFFLHKDMSDEEEDEERKRKERRRRRRNKRRALAAGIIPSGQDHDDSQDSDDEYDDDDDDEDDDSDTEPEGGEGPPLIYVLNLVNTKHDKSVKRGAVVKAMAICTRHPFLHIYKPLLLLALEEYFKSPVPETLSMLYDAVNEMDLSLMPKLSLLERHLLLGSENRDLFVEKFERMIQARMAEDRGEATNSNGAHPTEVSRKGTKAHIEVGSQSAYSVPRDTHEFESHVMYKGIPIPIKVPTAVMPETVGDFSLVKLIQNFSETHAKSPQPFPIHPHLTTSGANTHPIIVLINGLLTQKRVIFLGHNMPSGEVAEAVLAACALASGGVLRGFTRHAFPYTDLTKIDDLLNVPGFIAGVTNPTFELHPEWWDVLCDLPSGRIKISSKIEPAPITEGLVYFQQQNPALATVASGTVNNTQDLTGDQVFMADILRSIAARHGERTVRAKWRDWVLKFTRVSAQFEESVYGASALFVGTEEQNMLPPGATGHGYVWSDDAAKNKELAGNVTRIEGWRNTRSYYSFIQDLAQVYTVRPLKGLDLAHLHDRLRMQRLNPSQSRDIYLTLSRYIHSYDEICLFLSVAPESHAGLFYLALGLFHKEKDVRLKTTDLLGRIAEHEAGQHWWKSLSRFEKLAFDRIRRDADAEIRAQLEKDGLSPVFERKVFSY
ncbi:Spindle pole body interacting protein [Beauveria brongniartii RCEF 3172]|uniref:Spindle pole body interacting protein n=1 Tax=Beauveria brongniartii RCEF 3172 TaxID=1081107 RepID=A0A167J5Y4_9HYPO|nr:Spindle pole body interacting protein [Beauveria brongniartii RCEF 3172]